MVGIWLAWVEVVEVFLGIFLEVYVSLYQSPVQPKLPLQE